jgi:predicted RNA-binding Zn ribbon-like protein
MAEVPTGLWLLESYLNSVDLETGKDDLASVPKMRTWLTAHGREAAARTATPELVALARDIRAELREMLRGNCHGEALISERLDELASRVPLRARFTRPDIRLEPAADGVLSVLGEVLAAVVVASREGTWHRLKLCREDTCQVVFYDRSKNASRCWCSMQVCGNRNKTRAYRRRTVSAES